MVRTTKNLYMYLLCFCPREHHHRYVVISFVWTPFYPLFMLSWTFSHIILNRWHAARVLLRRHRRREIPQTGSTGRPVGHEGGFDKVEQTFRHRENERTSVRGGGVGVRSRVDVGVGVLNMDIEEDDDEEESFLCLLRVQV